MSMFRSEKLRKSAKGEDCTMGSPACNGRSDTVVWCHSNYGEHGKGMGLKSHDLYGFYGCSGCHEWYDRTSKEDGTPADERRRLYQQAHDRSLLRVFQKGVFK